MNNKETKPWEQKQEELNNHYYFFMKYLEHEGKISIPKFYKKLKQETEKNHEFSYKLPTWKTFETWAYVEEWFKRKSAYQKYQNELLLEKIQQSYLDDMEEIFSLNQSITKKGLGKAKAILSDDKFSGFNFEKVMKGTDIAIQNNRLVTGEPTEITSNKNINVNKDVDSTDELNKLFDDL